MSYTAIADVGDSLVALLRDRIDLIDANEIALASPSEGGAGNGYRLTVFLYRVTENGDLGRVDEERSPSPPPRNGEVPAETASAPLVLDLHYLLTAHPARERDGGGGDHTRAEREQHSVLGRAMQVLHDHSTLRGSDLVGDLSPDRPLHVTVESGSVDRQTSLWNTFRDAPYRPSVSYLVTPVEIPATETTDVQRVATREVEEFDASPGGGSGGG